MFLPLLGCFALLIGSFGFTIFTLLMLPALHAGPSPPTMPFADIPFLPLWWAILTSTTPFPILSGTSPLTSTLFRLPTSTGPWTLDSPLSTYQGSRRGFPLTCLHAPLSSTCPFPTPLWPPLSPRGTFLSPPLGRITCPFGSCYLLPTSGLRLPPLTGRKRTGTLSRPSSNRLISLHHPPIPMMPPLTPR